MRFDFVHLFHHLELKVELESSLLAVWASATLLEDEWVSCKALTERILLTLRIIWILSIIEAFPQLSVAQDFVCLVQCRHLPLHLVWCQVATVGIRVPLQGLLAECLFDLALG